MEEKTKLEQISPGPPFRLGAPQPQHKTDGNPRAEWLKTLACYATNRRNQSVAKQYNKPAPPTLTRSSCVQPGVA
jgi:hypothetical protein